MTHGKNLHLAEAKASIKNFVKDEMKRTGKHEMDIAVGHLFDLSLMKNFMADIEKLNSHGKKITGVRIYYAKSTRLTVTEEYDVVIVPVQEDGKDFYPVYQPKSSASETSAHGDSITSHGMLGASFPCPNVCK